MTTVSTTSDAQCPVCRGSECVLKFEKDGAPIYFCPRCSFRFALPTRNANLDNAIDEFESSYLQYFEPAPRDTMNFDRLVAWMERFCRLDRASVLDVGAGSGKFVRYLHDRGVNALGLEPSAALHEHFLASDERFVCLKLTDFPATDSRKFDVITAFDVIEHVDDPVETIESIARLLRPGGHVFVSTPDAGCLHARLAGRYWHYYHRYHLSYWSRELLESVAARFGMRARYFGRRSRHQTLGYILAYFWEHFIGGRAPRVLTVAERIYFPVNLFDVMYMCFEKVDGSNGARDDSSV